MQVLCGCTRKRLDPHGGWRGSSVGEKALKVNLENWVELQPGKSGREGAIQAPTVRQGKGSGNSRPHWASVATSSFKLLELRVCVCHHRKRKKYL